MNQKTTRTRRIGGITNILEALEAEFTAEISASKPVTIRQEDLELLSEEGLEQFHSEHLPAYFSDMPDNLSDKYAMQTYGSKLKEMLDRLGYFKAN